MNIKQLTKNTVINQMAYYLTQSANDTEQDECIVYHFCDSCVSYEKTYRMENLEKAAQKSKRNRIFKINVRDLIHENALQLVPTYDCERDNIDIKNLDKLLQVLESYYDKEVN